MIKGIHLTLLMGPFVPVPVPKPIIDALTEIEVESQTAEPSGFTLKFRFSSRSALNNLLFIMGNIGPIIRTVIFVTHKGMPHVLMDGLVTNQQVNPDVSNGTTTLTLTGGDLTSALGHEDFTGVPYPGMPPFARVGVVLAKYLRYGIIPVVIPEPSLDVPNPAEKIPNQCGSDLDYIKSLARRAGYVFYVDPGPAPGVSTAYWGPEIKVGVPQPALNINMDAHTNVESLSVMFDSGEKSTPVVTIHNKETKVSLPIPIPDFNPLSPPLGALTPRSLKIERLKDTGKDSPATALMKGFAAAAGKADVVSAKGSLNVQRYGHILKSRQLVGVRGAGLAFDGLYFVKSVTHQIKRGEYKQDFTLTRNGLFPTVPLVRP